MSMTSPRPYLVRAFYEWIVDNQLTPYIVLDTNIATVRVPEQFIEGGRIVLNISPDATQNLNLDGGTITFEASFQGVVNHIFAPSSSVQAIYARENGRGMVFQHEEDADFGGEGFPTELDEDVTGSSDDDGDGQPPEGGGKPPKLRIVK